MVRALARSLLLGAVLSLPAGAATPQSGLPAPRKQTPAQTQTQPVHPAKIDRNGVLILVRSTLLALDQANQTGNYTVLRDLGAEEFQRSNTASRLSDIFRPLRTQNLDLSGAAVLEPQLTLLPQVESNGQLHMTGFFPSVPMQIKFDMFFGPSNDRWRLMSLSVSLGSAMPGPGN